MVIARFILVFACLLGAGYAATERPISIDASADAMKPTVRAVVSHPDLEQAKEWLRLVRVDEASGTEGPALFGTYGLRGDAVEFTPEFSLAAGGHYRAILTVPGRDAVRADYTAAPRPPATRPAVARVYPSGDALPANLLKFYIYFSKPMRQMDGIFEELKILDDVGNPVYDPWRRLQQWSDDGLRLTLWIHPGRVKRGVNLRDELGPVLVPGREYRLVVPATLLDLDGQPMAKAFEKRFTATAEDHERVAEADWKVTPPAAGTREPVVVRFPKAMDEALARRLITVRDFAGTTETAEHETVWRFTPAAPWSGGTYSIAVDDLLEDLSGNTPVRVFDSEITTQRDATTRPAAIRFTPVPRRAGR